MKIIKTEKWLDIYINKFCIGNSVVISYYGVLLNYIIYKFINLYNYLIQIS